MGRRRRTYRRVAATSLSVLLVVGLVFGWVFWRTSHGGLSLAWIETRMEDVVARVVQPLTLELEGARLRREPGNPVVELELKALRILSPAGKQRLHAEGLRIVLDSAALWHRQIAVLRVRVEQLRGSFTREADGRFDFGVPAVAGTPESGKGSGLLDFWENPSHPLHRFEGAEIQGIQMTVDDQKLQRGWGLAAGTLAVGRTSGGFKVHTAARARLEQEEFNVSGEVVCNMNNQRVQGWAQVDKVQLSALASLGNDLAILGGIDLAASARVEVDSYSPGKLGRVGFAVQTGPGDLRIAGVYPDRLGIQGLALEGEMDPDFGGGRLTRGRVDLGPGILTLKASAMRDQAGYTLDVDAAIDSVTLPRLAQLWPAAAAPEVRRWIAENLPEGRVSDILARARLGLEPEDGYGASLEDLEGQFAFEALELTVLRPQPAIQKIDGSAAFSLERGFVFEIEGAACGEIIVDQARMTIAGLDAGIPRLDLRTDWQAPVQAAIDLLTSEPLAVVDSAIMPRDNFSGQASGTLGFGLPLSGPTILTDPRLEARLHGLEWRSGPVGLDLADGEVALTWFGADVTVEGTVSVGGVPTEVVHVECLDDTAVARRIHVAARVDDAGRRSLGMPDQPVLTGPVKVEAEVTMDRDGSLKVEGKLDLAESGLDLAPLGWSKGPGVSGHALFNAAVDPDYRLVISLDEIVAPDLHGRARAGFHTAPFALDYLELESLEYGSNQITVIVTQPGPSPRRFQVSGARFDLQPLLKFAVGGSRPQAWVPKTNSPPEAAGSSWTLELDLKETTLGAAVWLRDLIGQVEFDGRSFQKVSLQARSEPGKGFSVSYRPEGEGYVFGAKAGGAVAVLAAALNDARFEGGSMDGSGTRVAVDEPLTGQLEVSDLTVIRSPILMRLLTIGSMEGLLGRLRNQGVHIRYADCHYSLQAGRLDFRDLRVYGDLGLTADGFVDLRGNRVHVEGALAPAQALQRAIGQIPLLGPVLTGVRKEGFVALWFTIDGPFSDLKVKAEPMSTLTPGILRDFKRLLLPKKPT